MLVEMVEEGAVASPEDSSYIMGEDPYRLSTVVSRTQFVGSFPGTFQYN